MDIRCFWFSTNVSELNWVRDDKNCIFPSNQIVIDMASDADADADADANTETAMS